MSKKKKKKVVDRLNALTQLDILFKKGKERQTQKKNPLLTVKEPPCILHGSNPWCTTKQERGGNYKYSNT